MVAMAVPDVQPVLENVVVAVERECRRDPLPCDRKFGSAPNEPDRMTQMSGAVRSDCDGVTALRSTCRSRESKRESSGAHRSNECAKTADPMNANGSRSSK